MRIVFMGTPDFALPALEKLVEKGHEIAAVVTQPDKPTGRGRMLAPPPVKKLAESLGLAVIQPASLKKEGIDRKLRSLRPDAIVVAAFGQLLPRSVLDIPPLGCINIHPSLLPKHRGSSPIAGAILAGEDLTGVTIMLMDEGWDTGAILSQRTVPIGPDETTADLEKRLAQVGADLLVETLPRWAAGQIRPRAQDQASATYTRPITREDGRIDWRRPAVELSRRCRAFNPWPGCYTGLEGRLLKIWRAQAQAGWRGAGAVGEVIEVGAAEPGRARKRIGVATGEGLLLLDEVQLEGSRAMPVEQLARGRRGFVGSRLG